MYNKVRALWKSRVDMVNLRIWLHDLAREKPTSFELHGFDISLDQIGPKAWLPANVHMHKWNIFDEPDPRFLGYFDVVHVRLITVVVRNNDPQPILANLTKLLSTYCFLAILFSCHLSPD